jgi:6-phosphofructokinase 1
MIRLRRDDFQDPHELAKFAATCGISLQDFRNEFEYLIQDEPPPLDLDKDAAAARMEDGAHQG